MATDEIPMATDEIPMATDEIPMATGINPDMDTELNPGMMAGIAIGAKATGVMRMIRETGGQVVYRAFFLAGALTALRAIRLAVDRCSPKNRTISVME